VLSQLSYGPGDRVVGLGGFEPPTSPLSGVRSNQLSYKPEVLYVCLIVPITVLTARFYSSNLCERLRDRLFIYKGGDPAAGSPTATLLRLHPSHEPQSGKRHPEG
jgi:hypothetical protein